ncbi:MAG: response regulator [Patescibacteria group bacterium]|jgi:DNA-binding response OmpR family regulator
MPDEAKKIKVLIVDDDAFLSGIYATKLELDGFAVVSARDGDEGIKAALKELPDLILLDVLMPKLDGFEVLKRLKAEETTKNIPVIMLTNLGQKEDVEKGLQEGAADYLIKAHFVPAEAVAKIKKVLKMA